MLYHHPINHLYLHACESNPQVSVFRDDHPPFFNHLPLLFFRTQKTAPHPTATHRTSSSLRWHPPLRRRLRGSPRWPERSVVRADGRLGKRKWPFWLFGIALVFCFEASFVWYSFFFKRLLWCLFRSWGDGFLDVGRFVLLWGWFPWCLSVSWLMLSDCLSRRPGFFIQKTSIQPLGTSYHATTPTGPHRSVKKLRCLIDNGKGQRKWIDRSVWIDLHSRSWKMLSRSQTVKKKTTRQPLKDTRQ